jgi:hypothetical protein
MLTLRIALMFSMLTLPARSQEADPQWFASLKVQLELQHGCELAFVLDVEEPEDSAAKVLKIRVECRDGRQFFATRTHGDASFTLETCSQQVCRSDQPAPADRKSSRG